MTTQAEKFADIAKAIRNVNGRVDKHKIIANDFVSEINKLDPEINTYSFYVDEGYGGRRAVECAKSYYHARIFGKDKFTYSVTNAFSKPNKDGGIRTVRDNDCAQIDCSTFISLCLRGIHYENSPYAKLNEDTQEIEKRDSWKPAEELFSMYATYPELDSEWIFRTLDKQEKYHRDGVTVKFTDLGIDNFSSIRTAAHIGEYFYKNGYVVYDRIKDGEIEDANELLNFFELKPGDLIFWSNEESTSTESLGRFRSITHVAMVSEEPNAYYHVTGTKGRYDQAVVKFNFFDNNNPDADAESHLDDDSHTFEMLTLICRPDYRPKISNETPKGHNLLSFPWACCYEQYRNKEATSTSYLTVNTDYGITFKIKNSHDIVITGTSTEGFNTNWKGSWREYYKEVLRLTPGTYELGGINGEKWTKTTFALQILKEDGSDFSTPVRYPFDENSTNRFTITENTNIRVRSYIGAGVEFPETGEKFTPELIRVK